MKTAIAAVSVLAISGAAFGQAWNESGDAGDAVGAAAQVVTGSGALTAINGSTDAGAGDLTDAYVIRITDGSAFFASTDNTIAGDSDFDTRLWLFDLAGNAVLGNDDSTAGAANFSFQSFLSDAANYTAQPGGGTVDPSATGATIAPGDYILAISGFSQEAFDANGVRTIDMAVDFDALHGPNAASTGVLDSWEDTGFEATGSYSIALGGAEFIPAPGAVAMLGLGGLAAARRRR
ncbi:MAG: hypothetical protein AAGD00_00800 [Planctomycetota bacterium]